MKMLFFCTRWGSENISWPVFLENVKKAGYDGIEWGIYSGTTERELDEVSTLLNQYQLALISQHWETNDADFSRHFDTYCAWLERVKPYQAVKINTQTGKDYFTTDQNMALFKASFSFGKSNGIPIVHETHRNKSLYAAHIAKQYFDGLQELRITLDISHWVTVAESYLHDQQEAVITALDRTDHLHARIGHTQGPQITDPRLNQWNDVNEIFFKWWDDLIAKKKATNSSLTITPEFGPYPYMTMLPSGQPVCDQWEVNLYMMNAFKSRYGIGH